MYVVEACITEAIINWQLHIRVNKEGNDWVIIDILHILVTKHPNIHHIIVHQ